MSAIGPLHETLKYPLDFGFRHPNSGILNFENQVHQASLVPSGPINADGKLAERIARKTRSSGRCIESQGDYPLIRSGCEFDGVDKEVDQLNIA